MFISLAHVTLQPLRMLGIQPSLSNVMPPHVQSNHGNIDHFQK
ncbi:predicted protein [Plenodomus lingam JN3]|uniref:Predicted protein n=1 Tax=Leptosphaeria maculans (strain JN3 / isolate v23.1.3 / race Av1-4-5-6-7-8) TaxID=985895 RepID=E5AFA7_LEPMJ|nr:predicted protein [Plenodomus lingam JN3]CBY01896.1 predicted protein [Plenodomus lingam JN3]